MTAGAVAATLASRIRRAGPISIADYMSAVTEAYYARGDVFGTAGDFITAPEISQTFGELVGLWCAVIWRDLGTPSSFRLVECGPGRGTLMKDLLRATGRVPGFNAAADINLIERSAALQAVQRQTLAGHSVTWRDDVGAVAPGPMILVANEFLDALPVQQFEKSRDGWMERFVDVDANGRFIVVLKTGIVEDPPPAKVGAIFETSPAIRAFISQVSSAIARDGGAALLIDYGHASTAAGETLQAVKKHRPCGILDIPGEADLTAHVDFSAVARTAQAGGLKVFGPLAQGAWLNRLGIKLRGLQLANGKAPDVGREIDSGIRHLTAPDAMGVLFKVIALTHPALATPDGFQQDASA